MESGPNPPAPLPHGGRGDSTVARALADAERRLTAAGVPEPRLDARILVGHALGLSAASLLSHPDRRISAAESAAIETLLARRQAREPLAYIVGHREFYGLDLLVDERVLVPRPETELLVEEALRLTANVTAPRFADVGTGSGAIAVALAASRPTATVAAIDVSDDSLAVARDNARRHGVGDRIGFLRGDLLSPLGASDTFDAILANLPYVAARDVDAAQPEVRREPRLALDGGPDGLDVYRRLLRQAPPHLRPNGALLFEIAADQGPAAAALARAAFPAARVEVRRDYAGLDRFVVVETRQA